MSEAPLSVAGSSDPAHASVRPARCIVKVNGAAVSGWTQVEIDNNEFFNPDTFRVELSMNALPADHNVAWFAEQTDLEVEIFVGFPTDPTSFDVGELTSVFLGDVDEPEFQWDEGLICLPGRDKTHLFVDHKTSEKYVNLTSSQIATKLAKKYGLTPVVTGTKTKVGVYYTRDQVNLKDDRTEWDLLTWLARQEGFDIYVKGKELHFQPKKQNQRPTVFRWTPPPADGGPPAFDGIRLHTSHVLTVANDISVTVRSHSTKHKKTTVRRAAKRSPKPGSHTQQYTYTIPGLTPDQVQQRANQIRDELSKHEFKLEISGPADLTLAVGQTIQLIGTGTKFDQIYWPDSITRRLTNDGGFDWTISAKNHDPESTPTP